MVVVDYDAQLNRSARTLRELGFDREYGIRLTVRLTSRVAEQLKHSRDASGEFRAQIGGRSVRLRVVLAIWQRQPALIKTSDRICRILGILRGSLRDGSKSVTLLQLAERSLQVVHAVDRSDAIEARLERCRSQALDG